MAYQDMVAELRGSIPKVPYSYALTLINRAWGTVRDRNLWSFQLFEGQWISPPELTGTGTAAAVQGSNEVTLDATALAYVNAALLTQAYSLLTRRQFRIGLSGIYNIWGFDDATGILTLDRQWAEASSTTSGYMIYQCYYVAQQNSGANPSYLTDFRSWLSIRNLQQNVDLETDRYTRTMLDAIDPQRTCYFMPTDVVPYQIDQNPDSASYRAYMFELWGQPLANYVHQLFGLRRGADLSAPLDRLPYAVGEDCVMALARVYAYEWAEANKDMNLRSTGPDYRFLMGAATKEFETLLKQYRKSDREIVDNWFSVRRNVLPQSAWGYYNSIGQTANPGPAW